MPPLRPLAAPEDLLRLRWAALALQLGFVLALASAQPLPWRLLAGLGLLLGLLGQLFSLRRPAPATLPAALIALDTALLGLLLWANGGALSGFTSLYLLYPALAGAILSPRATGATVGLVLLGYAAMLAHLPPTAGHHHGPPGHDLRGHAISMFLAVAIASPLLAFALLRARLTLAQADERLDLARRSEEQGRRLSSLATLAAGAAHELATPLGTIAVVAGEQLRKAAPGSEEARDAALVRTEVERCRRVLSELAADVGAGSGEAHRAITLDDLLDLCLEGQTEQIEVDLPEALEERTVHLPPRLVAQAVRRLLGNAVQASPEGRAVRLRLLLDGEALCVEVEDQGEGMAPEVLSRASEPFFSTREGGMGLGLWFARTVAERLGGGLRLRSRPGEGTVASLRVRAGGEA